MANEDRIKDELYRMYLSQGGDPDVGLAQMVNLRKFPKEGILIQPDSDEDATIFKVDVDGNPEMSWDESEDELTLNFNLRANGILLAGDNFSNQLLHVRDEKAANTPGGTFSSGAWRTRTLNTVKTNEITGASLGSNQIPLPAGIFWIEAQAPALQCNRHKIKLYQTSGTPADIVIGTSEFSNVGGAYAQTQARLSGRFTLASSQTIELQHRCQTTHTSNGLGVESNFGVIEVYAEVKIWKVG